MMIMNFANHRQGIRLHIVVYKTLQKNKCLCDAKNRICNE